MTAREETAVTASKDRIRLDRGIDVYDAGQRIARNAKLQETDGSPAVHIDTRAVTPEAAERLAAAVKALNSAIWVVESQIGTARAGSRDEIQSLIRDFRSSGWVEKDPDHLEPRGVSIDPAQALLDGRAADPPTQLEVQGAKLRATGGAGGYNWVITGADGREVELNQDQARAIGPVMGRCSTEHAVEDGGALKMSRKAPTQDREYTDAEADLICALRRHGGDASLSRVLEETGIDWTGRPLPDCVSIWESGNLGLDEIPDPCPGCGES